MKRPEAHLEREDLMRYLDRELSPERRARLEEHVEACTECRREVALFDALGARLAASAPRTPPGGSVWEAVRRRLTRPVGWLLFLAGLAVWLSYGLFVYGTSPASLWEKLASGAIFIGLALLLGSILREHYAEWRRDPYRHIER